jgi:hypothetical protein
MVLRILPNRDRERLRSPSPPTPPGIRITYQGGSVALVGHLTNWMFRTSCQSEVDTQTSGLHDGRLSLRSQTSLTCPPYRSGLHYTVSWLQIDAHRTAGFPVMVVKHHPYLRDSMYLLCPLLTSAIWSGSIALPSAGFSRKRLTAAYGRSPGVRHVTFDA